MDYRLLLKNSYQSARKTRPQLTLHKLASFMGIQSPYLSKVLHLNAHLSQDQLYMACSFLRIPADEAQILELSLEYERSSNPDRKEKLSAQLKALREKSNPTGKALGLSDRPRLGSAETAEYFLDPLCQLVHMAFLIPKYAKFPEKLAQDLFVPQARINMVVEKLLELKLLRKVNNQFAVDSEFIHLPKDSEYLDANQNLLRSLSMQRVVSIPKEDRYNLAVTFTGDDQTFEKLRSLFMTFISQSSAVIKEAPHKKVFQMNFDLFPWT